MIKTLFSFFNKNQAIKLTIVAFIVLFIFPQVSLGIWWNPFSWNLFNNRIKNSSQLSKIQQLDVGVEQSKQKIITIKKITTTTTKVKDLNSNIKIVSTTTRPVVDIVVETTTTTQLTKTLNGQEKLVKQQELEQIKENLATLQKKLAVRRTTTTTRDIEADLKEKSAVEKRQIEESTAILQEELAMRAMRLKSSATTSTTISKTPKYLMPDKPIIETFCDNRGNCVHSQFADFNSKSYLSAPTVYVGETLDFTIKVSGEESSGVLAFIISQGYDWAKEGGMKPWSTNLTYTKTFSKDDINVSGYPIYAYIKSQNDNYHRKSGNCNWTDYSCDDLATLKYIVLP